MKNTVFCPNIETFCEVISGLTSRGLAFTASASDLSISITGY